MKVTNTERRSRRPVAIQAWSLALVVMMAVGLAQAGGAQAAAAASTSAQASDAVSVVDAFHAAGDDIEAALALLTDDVVIDLCCPAPPNTPGVWKGKAEARAFFEWRNGIKMRRVRAGDAHVEGNNVSGNVGVASDTFTRLGLGTVGHTFQAQVVDGKLKYYRGQLAPEEQSRVAAAFRTAGLSGAQPTGMPRTGGPLLLPLVLAIGTLMLAAGTALRKRKG
jgi:hypothetical protein